MILSLILACKDDAPIDSDTAPVLPECDVVSGDVCPWAGTGDAAFDGDGRHRLLSYFYMPIDVEVSPYGKPVIADWNNHKLRMVQDDDTLVTIMGTDFIGDGPPDFSDQVSPGAPGTTVNLNHPTDQVYLPDGMLLSASWHTHKMRTWDPVTGLTLVVGGAGAGFGGDGGPVSAALFNQPKAVILDSEGAWYIVDMRNERIRKVGTDGVINTIAGSGTQDDCGDDGPALSACFRFPKSAQPEPGGDIAFSPDESKLYVLDSENHRIRVIDMETGIITAFAGQSTAGYADGVGAAAQFSFPTDMELSPDGTALYVADTNNHRIRRVDLATAEVTTVAGTGEAADSGDGGPATDASFNRPFGVEFGLEGELYVTDTMNHRIRVIWP